MTVLISTRDADGWDRVRFSSEAYFKLFDTGVLPSDLRAELVGGELLPMAPLHLRHGSFTMRLGSWAINTFEPSLRVAGPISVVLSEDTVLEPDIAVFDDVLEGRVPVPARICQLAIEVADTTQKRDLELKAPRYAAAGVPEVWVVDLDKDVTHVLRQPTHEGYAASEHIPFATRLSPLCRPDASVVMASFV